MAQDTEWTPVSHDTCDQVAGPFYHGTRADLTVGELLSAGFRSNYRDSVVMNHIYFTTVAKGAGLAAEMARGEGRPRVYVVEPTGPFEDDPNVTNKKFPGNPTRSYRSDQPLRIAGEIVEWELDWPRVRSRRFNICRKSSRPPTPYGQCRSVDRGRHALWGAGVCSHPAHR